MLACKKEEKLQEETMLSPQNGEKEEQWGESSGEKEKNITEQEEDLKEMNSLAGGEIFEKALEVQEGREEPREDVPMDLTKYSYLYPQTNNSSTKKWVVTFELLRVEYWKWKIWMNQMFSWIFYVQVFLRDQKAAYDCGDHSRRVKICWDPSSERPKPSQSITSSNLSSARIRGGGGTIHNLSYII